MSGRAASGGSPDRSLDPQVAALARAVSAESSEPVTPERLAHMLCAALPSADACGLTLLRPGQRPRTLAATGPAARAVDELQYRLSEGPCLEAATETTVTMSTDLGSDPRWPRFGPQCVEDVGMRSSLGARVPLGGRDTAAMNFFAARTEAFGPVQEELATLLAPFAALAIQRALHEQDVVNLRKAMESGQQIGRAVGIVMSRLLVDADKAMDILRRASQHQNRKLSELAAEIEMTGVVPEDPKRPT